MGDVVGFPMWRQTFKMAAASRSMQQRPRPPAARYPAERVWRHWFVVRATVPDL